MSLCRDRIKYAFNAFLLHMVFSGLVAVIVGYVIFAVWYPHPYKEMAGGFSLFLIMVAVDVLCGPLLTAVVYSPRKSSKEMVFDLAFIVFLQLGALVYGLYSIYLARPVALVFEVDRFAVITKGQLVDEQFETQWSDCCQVSLFKGPMTVGLRDARNHQEIRGNIASSLAGIEPSMKQGWWQSYDASRAVVMKRMKKMENLFARENKKNKIILNSAVHATGILLGDLYYLPLVSERSLDDWIVILNANADLVGYAAVGGFED